MTQKLSKTLKDEKAARSNHQWSAQTRSSRSIARGRSVGTREGSLRSLFKRGFYPPQIRKYGQNVGRTNFFSFFLGSGASCGSIVVSSIPRPQLVGDGNLPFNRLVRGFSALLAFCYAFWAAAVSGAAAAANLGRRATPRREGARAHSYASHGAATVPWAGRIGHTIAIRGAHGGAFAPWGLEPSWSTRIRETARTDAPEKRLGALRPGLRRQRGANWVPSSRWAVRLASWHRASSARLLPAKGCK
jgi:hypothetical protein